MGDCIGADEVITANQIVMGVARALSDIGARIYAESPRKTTGELSALISINRIKETAESADSVKREVTVRVEITEGKPMSASGFSEISAKIGNSIRPVVYISDRKLPPESVEYWRSAGAGYADRKCEFYDDCAPASESDDKLMQTLGSDFKLKLK